MFTRHHQKHLAKQEQCSKRAVTPQCVPKFAVAEPKAHFREQDVNGQSTQAAAGQTGGHPQ